MNKLISLLEISEIFIKSESLRGKMMFQRVNLIEPEVRIFPSETVLQYMVL